MQALEIAPVSRSVFFIAQVLLEQLRRLSSQNLQQQEKLEKPKEKVGATDALELQ